MSGTVCGILDAYHYATVTFNQRQGFFKLINNFFERMVTVGNAARVALQYGASATGTDWYDGANPFGENAFAVYKLLASASSVRSYDLYVLIQFCSAASPDTAPGNPGRFNGSTSNRGVGFELAFREDGGNPWNGTTNNDGSDTKGSTVWTAGGSVLHLLDRANSDATPNGSFVTNKQNLVWTADPNSTYVRFHMIGDADGFLLMYNKSSTTTSGAHFFLYGGIYEPRAGLTIAHPIVMFEHNGSYSLANGLTVGTTAGSSYYEGGILNNKPTNKVQSFRTIYMSDLHKTEFQPNNQVSPVELDQTPLFIAAYEGADLGFLGQFPTTLFGIVWNVLQETTNAAKTRAYIGGTVQETVQFAMAWDGGDAPGVNTTEREGREL